MIRILSTALALSMLAASPAFAAAGTPAKPCDLQRSDQAKADDGTGQAPPVAPATDLPAATESSAATTTGSTATEPAGQGSEAWTEAHGSTAAIDESGDCTLSVGQ